MFGEWYDSADAYKDVFLTASPYPHVVIDNFFTEDTAERLCTAFPTMDSSWVKYWNPIEKKFAKNTFDKHPEYANLFKVLQSEEFVQRMKQITDIPTLNSDPYLHGAGVHYHPRGGKLDMHLDYSIHPITGKERRVNLIIYMNREWDTSYGGDIQLWDSAFTSCVKKVEPVFNRAVLFQTSDISYHGLPNPITCPEGEGRRSIAIYYVSEPRPEATPRYKAQFRALPWQPEPPELSELYRIREKQIITPDILKKVYPDWETQGGPFW